MVTNVPDWICNFLLWTAIVTTVVLTVDQFTPILNGLTGLVDSVWSWCCRCFGQI